MQNQHRDSLEAHNEIHERIQAIRRALGMLVDDAKSTRDIAEDGDHILFKSIHELENAIRLTYVQADNLFDALRAITRRQV